jgi:hypothetical protein
MFGWMGFYYNIFQNRRQKKVDEAVGRKQEGVEEKMTERIKIDFSNGKPINKGGHGFTVESEGNRKYITGLVKEVLWILENDSIQEVGEK